MKKINPTQKKILQAAKHVYQQVGYSGSTFHLIAEKAETSRSLINYYYPKKQDILVDILGRYLDTIHEYIKSLGRFNSLEIFMLTFAIYTKSMFASEASFQFTLDVSQRNDRDLGPYRNYNTLYENILREYNINMTQNELLYKEIAIFGAMSELLMSYQNKSIDVSENELIELILQNTCNLLHLSNYEINKYLDSLWKDYNELKRNVFPFFDSESI